MSLSVTPEILLPPVCPNPRSLATTSGISVDVFSSPYLDVSVQAVPFAYLFDSVYDTLAGGFPHSEISGSMLICSSPKLIAAYHVFHRLLMPRHSPCALFSLTLSDTHGCVSNRLTNKKSPIIGSLISRIMQTHQEVIYKIVFYYPLIKNSFCCSHNCIIIDSMFSFQGAVC